MATELKKRWGDFKYTIKKCKQLTVIKVNSFVFFVKLIIQSRLSSRFSELLNIKQEGLIDKIKYEHSFRGD